MAAAVRMYRLTDRSLWLDETVTAQSAHLSSAGDVIAQSLVYVNQAPLFYLITWLLRPWGDGEFILRLPAAVAGTLTVFAVYLVGRQLFRARVGLVAALLIALMPYAVWYSQEARNYALFMLLTTMQVYFAFTAVKRSRWLDWVGLALFTTLNIYNHYLALAPTAGVVVFIGVCLGVELLRGTGTRTKAISALMLAAGGALTVLVARRAVFKAAFLAAADILAKVQRHPAYALAALVAAAIVVGAFGLLLRRRTRKSKLSASAILLVALGFAIVVVRFVPLGSSGDSVALPAVAVLATLGLAFAVAAAMSVLDLLHHRPELVRRLEGAMIAGVLVALAYAPWLPYFRLALSRPDVTVGQLHASHQPGLNDIVIVLGRMGISGFLLVSFFLGLLALVVWLFHCRATQCFLVLCCLIVPLLVLGVSAGPAIVDIDVRYLGFLFPTAMLVMAIGVEAVALQAERAVLRVRKAPWPSLRIATTAPALMLTAILLVQALPALAASYQIQKEDYRSAAAHIVASGPAPILLSIGNYSDWSVITFGYYLKELHSQVAVVEGQALTSADVSTLAASTGIVWGVVVFPSPAQLQLLSSPGPERVDLIDVTHSIYLIRAVDPGLSPLEQARRLLRWEMPADHRVGATVKLIDVLNGHAQLGPNLASDLIGSGGWALQPGVVVSAGALVIKTTSVSPELTATNTTQIQAGADYLVSLEYRNEGLRGWQRVYATTADQTGRHQSNFPGGAGVNCPTAGIWTRLAFAFQAPADAVTVSLILRAHGVGTAQFRAVQLNPISDSL